MSNDPDESIASEEQMERWRSEKADWKPDDGFDPWSTLADLEATLATMVPGNGPLDRKTDRDLDRLATALWWLECGGSSRSSLDKFPQGLSLSQVRRWHEMDRQLYATDFAFSFRTACGLAGVTESRIRKFYPDVPKEVTRAKKARSRWTRKLYQDAQHPRWIDGHPRRAKDAIVATLDDSVAEYLGVSDGMGDRAGHPAEVAREQDVRNRERAAVECLPQPRGLPTLEFEEVPHETRKRHNWGFGLDTLPVTEEEVPWWVAHARPENASEKESILDIRIKGNDRLIKFGTSRPASAGSHSPSFLGSDCEILFAGGHGDDEACRVDRGSARCPAFGAEHLRTSAACAGG